MSTWHYIAVSFLCLASLAMPMRTAGEHNQTLSWQDGTRYVGGINDDRRHSRGSIYWQDGTRFIGEFKADLRQGGGIMILPVGTTYRGMFDDDRMAPFDDPANVIDAETAATESETDSDGDQDATVDAMTQQAIIDVLDLWAAAWMSKDVVQYLTLYSSDSQPRNNQSMPVWSLNRKESILTASYIQIDCL
ncbi:MAG TPA: hypothetical protein EYF99_01085 [Pseudomonadales bacterium]|nr:hypothetical protein [Pseudomonadales bacterium]